MSSDSASNTASAFSASVFDSISSASWWISDSISTFASGISDGVKNSVLAVFGIDGGAITPPIVEDSSSPQSDQSARLGESNPVIVQKSVTTSSPTLPPLSLNDVDIRIRSYLDQVLGAKSLYSSQNVTYAPVYQQIANQANSIGTSIGTAVSNTAGSLTTAYTTAISSAIAGGTSNFNGTSLTVSSSTTIGGSLIAGSTTLSSLNVSGGANINGALTVGSLVSGGQTIGGDFRVTGMTNLATTTITGAVTVIGNTYITSGGILNVGDKIISPGDIGLGTSTPAGKLAVQNTDPAQIAFIVVGTTSQSSPLIDVYDNPTSNTNLLRLTASGALSLPGTATLGGLSIGNLNGLLFSTNGTIGTTSTSSLAINTDNLVQGLTNLFWSSNLFDTRFHSTTTDALQQGTVNRYYGTNLFATDLAGTTTNALPQGTLNKYYSTNLFAIDLHGTTTDALPQGSTNLFWSNTLFDNRFNPSFDTRLFSTTSLSNLATLAGLYTTGSTTGVTTILGKTILTNASTTNLTATTLTAGDITATGTLAVTGTATSTVGTGGLTVGTSQFVVQTGTGNVGIGTAAPWAKFNVLGADVLNASQSLNVSGSSGTGLVVTNANMVGIGSVSPNAYLQVMGSNSNQLSLGYDTNNAVNFSVDSVGSTALNLRGTTPKFEIDFPDTTSIPTDSIPLMTSVTTPSGIVTSSSNWDSTYTEYKAFDNNYSTTWIASSGSGPIGWLAYQFATAKTIVKYTISGYSPWCPKNWTFEGWTGSAWVILDTQINQGCSGTYTFSNTTSYIKYRINISASNGTYSGINELEMMEAGATKAVFNIANSGNVGIGTTSPLAKLDIYGTAGSADIFSLSSSTNTRLLTVNSAGNLGIGTSTPNMKFSLWGSGVNGFLGVSSTTQGDIFKIDTTGNVGIGSSTPSNKLTVNGNGYFTGNLTTANLTATGTLTVAGITNSGSITSTATSTASAFVSTSATAVSTFSGGLNVAGLGGLNVLQNGTVGIGTSTPVSAAQFEVAVGSLSVQDTYYDQSKVASVNQVTVSGGQIRLALAWTCGSHTLTGPDGLTYGTVVGADGNCWLDRNLGATQVATAYNDYNAYGSLFQWGRLADDHQKITWTSSSAGTVAHGTTATLSSTDNPGTNLFITNGSSPYDWRNPQSNSLWQGVNGINNPCPSGFRLPTQTEWATLVAAAPAITNSATAYSSSLKLVVAGDRNSSDGSLYFQGSNGHYWSSSVSGANAFGLYFSASSVRPADYNLRAYGLTVRCIKN